MRRKRTPFLLRWYILAGAIYLVAVSIIAWPSPEVCGSVIHVVPDKARAYLTIDDGQHLHVAVVPLDMIAQAAYGQQTCVHNEWILSTSPR